MYAWRESKQLKQEIKPNQLQLSKIRPVGISCVLPVAVEQYLPFWVRSLRKEGIPVSTTMMCIQAKILAEEHGIQPEKFKASHQWQSGFMNRYRLSLRCKSNQAQVSPNDVQKEQEKFAQEVKEKAKNLGVKVIWNADQTPIQYEMIPRKTLDNKNNKTIWVRYAGKDKERVSVMLLANSRGEKKNLCFVMKQNVPTALQAFLSNKENRREQRTDLGLVFGKMCKNLLHEMVCKCLLTPLLGLLRI